jgi:hypothetical protein
MPQTLITSCHHAQNLSIKFRDRFYISAWINVGKPKGKELLGRPRRRWVDNIRIDLVEMGWGDVDWIGLAQDRDRWRVLVNSVLNLRVP